MQECLEPVRWTSCDAFEHVAQAEFRVESIELRRTELAVDGRAFAVSIGTNKEVVLAPRAIVRSARSAAELSISMRPSSKSDCDAETLRLRVQESVG